MISRTHPGLLKRLFELEVPEIYEGVVELKSVARDVYKRQSLSNPLVFSFVPLCQG